MESPEDTIVEMKRQLERLVKAGLGYPLGSNVIHPPGDPCVIEEYLGLLNCGDNRTLSVLYKCCDGFELPDIHIGYFVDRLSRVKDRRESDLSLAETSEGTLSIVPFGSTGGGGRFAVNCNDASVLHLAPGLVKEGVYRGRECDITKVAGNSSEFLEKVLSDMIGFLHNHPNHRFIASS